MIKIISLTLKNFLSVGNQTQAIKLDNTNLTLVLGENLDLGGDDAGSRNGCGKSAFINAISYCLYGQALTFIKKDNLINRQNLKNMLVTVEFSKDDMLYRIERGRKPNILHFYINNIEQEIVDLDESQGDSRCTQEEINKILGMSHEMFCNIVALNTDSTPFLAMRAADQRTIIEQLLGITLLSEKAEKLKNEIKNTKEQITNEKSKIEAILKSNKHIQITINALKTKQTQWLTNNEEEIETLSASLLELENINIEEEIENQNKLILYNKKTALYNDLVKLNDSYVENERELQSYEEKLTKLQNKTCYTCGQHLHDNKNEELIAKITENIETVKSTIININDAIQEIKNEYENIDINVKPKVFYKNINDVYDHKTNWNILKVKLEEKLQESDPYDQQIKALEEKAIQKIDESILQTLNVYLDHQEFVLKLLVDKNSFIRKKIIKQNLNFLNKKLENYLEQMGMAHEVEFLDDLSVDIKMLGRDFDFNNLSRGEKTRLTLSLSWAFRELWENSNNHINLLCIDELLDSGLDSSGVERAIHTLKSMARDQQRNVFLISHREELCSRVNTTLKVVKENSFTTYIADG